MSPVLIHISDGGNCDDLCHRVPVLTPLGSQTASVAKVNTLPTLVLPVITGADINI